MSDPALRRRVPATLTSMPHLDHCDLCAELDEAKGLPPSPADPTCEWCESPLSTEPKVLCIGCRLGNPHWRVMRER